MLGEGLFQTIVSVSGPSFAFIICPSEKIFEGTTGGDLRRFSSQLSTMVKWLEKFNSNNYTELTHGLTL